MRASRAFTRTTAGTIFQSSGGSATLVAQGFLVAAASGDDAIVSFADGGGVELCRLAAPAGETAVSTIPVAFSGDITITLVAGAGPSAFVYV